MRNYVDGNSTHAPPVNVIAGSVGYNTQQWHSLALDGDFVRDLKKQIDDRMDMLEKEGKPDWALKRQSPPVISLAVEMLLDQFKHRRTASEDAVLPHTRQFTEAMDGYYSFFHWVQSFLHFLRIRPENQAHIIIVWLVIS